MEVSIMHHVAIVLLLLWLLSHFNRCHPVAYFVSLMYLFLVHERYVMRLQKKLQYEEKKQANQKRVLSDSETVRWLNHAVVKIWPICMEQIASQKILLPIIPWFLEKYKPWTAKKASVQHMYLGRNPPLFTEMRVLQESTGDDHLVLELGMNFCTADDMNAILAVKLRNRLGFGMWAKLHMTGIHVEGKVLIGVKFLRQWPYLGRLRVCFAEPPYFQMTVKPIFTHGLDVTELPGIAGWLDKLLSVAFEQTLVQPNMLVVDMEKFASPKGETWFSVNEKDPVAYAKVEVVEASDMKPSDLNGLADPYVKGQLGLHKFRTKTQWKTLSPKWQEEFRIPIFTWESPNMLDIEVRDKDHFVDDSLGNCAVNINDFKDGERYDLWLPLQNIKMGRLHLAITVLEENVKVGDNIFDGKTMDKEEMRESFASEMANMASFSSLSSEKSPRVPDNFEPINIEGQQETGVWVHHPGSEVSQKWEPRKGKGRRADTQVQRVPGDSFDSNRVAGSGPLSNDSSSGDEDAEGKNQVSKMRRGLNKISSVFHRNHKKEDNLGSNEETLRSPYANIRASNQKEIGVKLIIEDSITEPSSGKDPKDINSDPKDVNVSSGKDPKDINVSSDGSGPESPGKGNMKGMAKNILKHAEKSARNIKHALSRKGSRKSHTDSSAGMARDIIPEYDSSNDESLSSPRIQQAPVVSSPKNGSPWIDDSDKPKDIAVQTGSTDPAINVDGQMNQLHIEGTETRDDADVLSISNEHGNGLEQSSKSWLHEEDFEGEKK